MRVLPLLLALAVAGCVGMMQANPGMRGSRGYARSHKGEGTKRVLPGSKKDIRDALVEGWSKDEHMSVSEEGDALFATTSQVDFTYAVYFNPGAGPGKTEVEILMASPWLKPEALREHETKLLDSLAKGLAEKRSRGPKAPDAGPAPAKAKAAEPPPKPDRKFDSQL